MTRSNTRFRLQGELPEGVRAKLMVGRTPIEPTLIDISTTGVAVLLEGAADETQLLLARLESTRMVPFVLESPCLRQPMSVWFEPVHCQDIGSGVLIGARLRPGVSLQRQFEATVERLFNRRGAVRGYATAHGETPVGIGGEDEREEAQGQLRDLSLTGAGLRLPEGIAKLLPEGAGVRLSLFLVEDAPPVKVGATVVRLGPPHRGEVHVGFAFDAVECARPAVSAPVCRWVTERQLEDRRLSRERELAARRKQRAQEAQDAA